MRVTRGYILGLVTIITLITGNAFAHGMGGGTASGDCHATYCGPQTPEGVGGVCNTSSGSISHGFGFSKVGGQCGTCTNGSGRNGDCGSNPLTEPGGNE